MFLSLLFLSFFLFLVCVWHDLSTISIKTCFTEAFKAQSNTKSQVKGELFTVNGSFEIQVQQLLLHNSLVVEPAWNQFRWEKSETRRSSTQIFWELMWPKWTRETRTMTKECHDEFFVREPLSADISLLSSPHMTGLSRRCKVIFPDLKHSSCSYSAPATWNDLREKWPYFLHFFP